jgi:hypothetical protein
MKDFVSARGFRVIGLMASLWVVLAVFRIHDLVWTGLVCASLALAASLWVRETSNRSMGQVIDAVEAEPLRVAMTVRKAVP